MIHRWLIFWLLASAAATRAGLTLPETSATNTTPQLIVPAPKKGIAQTNSAVATPAPAPNLGGLQKLAPLAKDLPRVDMLSLTNGDSFPGQLQKIEAGIIQWDLTGAAHPVRLRTGGCEGLVLATPVFTNAPVSSGWLVGLTDGSLVRARQVSWKAGRLTAELGLAGRVTLERRQVAVLRRVAKGLNELVSLSDAPLYGPAESKQAAYGPWWRYRDMQLPDPLMLEFVWPHTEINQSQLRLFGGRPETPSPHLVLSAGDRRIWVTASDVGGTVFSSQTTNALGHSSWVTFTISRATGELGLYLDNKLFERTVLPAGLKFTRDGLLTFVGPSKIALPRAVIVSRFAELPLLPEIAPDKDTLLLANYDALSGQLETVTDTAAVFHGTTGRMELPLERVTRITLARQTSGVGPSDPALLNLSGGEILRGAVQRVDSNNVVVASSVLGSLTLPRAAVVHVDWNPDQPAPDWVDGQNLSRFPGRGRRMGGDPRWNRLYNRYGYQPGTLHLHSHVSYEGSLSGIRDGLVYWRHPSAEEPIAFHQDQVVFVMLPPSSWQVATTGSVTTVRLHNGNVLTGILGDGDAQNLSLTVPYTDRLTVPRRAVAQVSSNTAGLVLSSTVTSSEWRTSTDEPVMTQNGVTWMDSSLKHIIMREIKLPERTRVDIDATWSPPRMSIHILLSANLQEQPVHAYRVDFFSDKVGFMASLPKADIPSTATNFPSVQVMSNFSHRAHARLTAIVDFKTGHLRAYVEGHPVGEWRAPGGMTPDRGAVTIMAGGGAAVALRQVSISEWRDLPTPPVAPVPPPLDASRTATEALLVLHNGDRLTLDDLRWEKNIVTGRNKLVGPVTVTTAAVRSIGWPEAEGRKISTPRPKD